MVSQNNVVHTLNYNHRKRYSFDILECFRAWALMTENHAVAKNVYLSTKLNLVPFKYVFNFEHYACTFGQKFYFYFDLIFINYKL